MICPGRFEGKVAIVTGGSSGIGEACALDLAAEGAKVVVESRRSPEEDTVVPRILEAGGEAIYFQADVADPEQAKAMVDKAVEVYGRVDVAANMAAIGGRSKLMGDTSDEWTEAWYECTRNNIDGVFFSQRYEIAQMLKQGTGGSIVNGSSIGAFIGVANSGAYITSKWAIMGITKTAAIEYATQGIRINALNPHAVRTPMLEAGLKRVPSLEQRVVSQIPMGRLSTAEENARMTLFLLSDECPFATGQAYVTDGGFLSV